MARNKNCITVTSLHPYIINLIEQEAEKRRVSASQVIRDAIYSWFGEFDDGASHIKEAEDLLTQFDNSLQDGRKTKSAALKKVAKI